MAVLAIDSSTPDLIVGLVNEVNNETLSERIIENCRDQNALLVPTTIELLEKSALAFSDISAIVVGIGPGPFTGLRVGMATAAAFGDALGIAVHGVCSLDAMAAQSTESAILVASDARRKEIYYATYRNGQRTSGPDVIKPEEVQPIHDVDLVSIPEQIHSRLSDDLRSRKHSQFKPLPKFLVACADLSATAQPLEPLYLRRPDAKEPPKKPLSAAIVRKEH
ncbi:tRNA threonylcarbamoyladenosine biosynthesis protein Gcp [Corynebacterium kutscheri]|uniref:tRNA (adenosine(37)-N6)-threonylcarbamoyltransferase complex dimerization subunit type 1 TsaB n=1 Tax=Corynebacterium kutscheri TaxID=35755 RepID=UPI000F6E6F51|nr:tRNA (adenosine(37)-N6)-threonylcarbamoyltransferase complex dimerization subunit type 1 TsaB [Corynebacterium kutscheri]VEH80499.1 tRNA threonylcarbamoyladenosine biosynthesis protein Gcp [Corynebacterium kutscheri]